MSLPLFLIMSSVIAISYWLEEHTRWAAHISGVLLLIIIASVLGNSGVVSSSEETYSLLFKWAVPFGIVLMLLAFNPHDILKIKKEYIFCFVIGAVGTMIGGIVAGFTFKNILPNDYWRVSGQLTASFIGGYENAVAVGTSLNTPTAIFIKVFAGDSILTTLWILVNIFQGRKITHQNATEHKKIDSDHFSTSLDITSLAIILAVTFLILATSSYIHSQFQAIPKILWASIFATLMTFTPLKQRFSGSYVIGSLSLSYFFFGCGAISDVVSLFSNATILLLYPALIVAIHAVILFGTARIFKIKKEIVIIASQCLIGGPATALAVVTARKWNCQFEAIVLGLLGYAVGNYFGFGAAWLLK